MAIIRPTAPVTKNLEFTPVYAVEDTPGVLATTPTMAVDRIRGGTVSLMPGVQEVDYVGLVTERKAGLMRGSLDGLEFDVRSSWFIANAVRASQPWGQLPSLSFLVGSWKTGDATVSDQLQLYGCKINTLELSQEYSEDGAPLVGTASLLALGGVMSTGVTAVPSISQLSKKMSFHSTGNAKITTPAGTYRIRSWRISVNNNLHYVSYGDVAMVSGRSANVRQPQILREGLEEIEFDCTCEIPVKFANDLSNDFANDCYVPGAVTAAIVYTDPCGTVGDSTLTFNLTNLVAVPDFGFTYEYDSAGISGEPVHIYSFKAHKSNKAAASLTIAGT